MGKYNETTTLGTLLDDPEVVAIFSKHAGDLMNHPMIDVAKGMPFGTILGFATGQLSPEQTAELKAEILAL